MKLGLGDAVNGAGLVMSALGIGEGRQDRRQIEQQKRLNALTIAGNKEMADYAADKEFEMWNKTNWQAQLEHADKAGLSKAWLMGKGGGGGGTTAGSGMAVGSGQAANAAQTEAVALDKAMTLAQLANMNADTDKKKAEAEGLDRENDIIKGSLEDYKSAFQKGLDVRIIEGEVKNAEWEFEKAVKYDNNFESKNSPKAEEYLSQVKAAAENVKKISGEIENLQKSGKKIEAETKLTELEAQVMDFKKVLTDYGLNDTTANLANALLKAVLGFRGGKK